MRQTLGTAAGGRGRFRRGAVLILAGVTLAACSGTLLEKARKVRATGDAYTRTLAKAYMGLSKSEYDEGDYVDSDFFADRAIRAAQRERFGPQEISERDVPTVHINELVGARDRLVRVIAQGGPETAPENTALAIAAFDCWLQEAEEDRQPRDIRACREDFETAMGAVEVRQAPPPAPLDLNTVAGPAPQTYTIYFDLGSANITEEAADVLAQAAADARARGGDRIVVRGHTDTSGSASTNLALSERRAVNAMRALGRVSGIDSITAEGLGEAEPARPTGDGVREVLNRRAVIILY